MTKSWFHKTVIYLLILLFGSTTFALNLKQIVTSKSSEIQEFNQGFNFGKKDAYHFQLAVDNQEELVLELEDVDEDDDSDESYLLQLLNSDLVYFKSEKCFGFNSLFGLNHFTDEIAVRFPKTNVVNCVYII